MYVHIYKYIIDNVKFVKLVFNLKVVLCHRADTATYIHTYTIVIYTSEIRLEFCGHLAQWEV